MTLDRIFPLAKSVRTSPRATDAQVRGIAAKASSAIRDLQAMVGREYHKAAQIEFPRGYLREIRWWRFALRFVHSSRVRDSVADTLMMHDVQSWLLKRTDLAGHARDMLIKAAIGSLGSVAEALLIDATSPPMGARQKFASRVNRLREAEVLDDAAAAELNWLWEIRNRQHLHGLQARDYARYAAEDHPRAEHAIANLVLTLRGRSAPTPA